MANKFEQIDHKNIELLRFYLSKDMKKINSKIEANGSNIVSYTIASLVDVFVVVLFDDLIKNLIKKYFDSIGVVWQVIVRLGCIAVLIGLFCGVMFLSKRVLKRIQIRRELSGEQEYIHDDKKIAKIDDFDNIACDGLLICQNYIQRFQDPGIEDYEKAFCYYEVVHYLEKARRKFSEIYENNQLYIVSDDNYSSELIKRYRVNNFIDFANKILEFLKNHQSEMEKSQDLEKDIENLNDKITKWEKFE